jgi:hypothetical protein
VETNGNFNKKAEKCRDKKLLRERGPEKEHIQKVHSNAQK